MVVPTRTLKQHLDTRHCEDGCKNTLIPFESTHSRPSDIIVVSPSKVVKSPTPVRFWRYPGSLIFRRAIYPGNCGAVPGYRRKLPGYFFSRTATVPGYLHGPTQVVFGHVRGFTRVPPQST